MNAASARYANPLNALSSGPTGWAALPGAPAEIVYSPQEPDASPPERTDGASFLLVVEIAQEFGRAAAADARTGRFLLAASSDVHDARTRRCGTVAVRIGRDDLYAMVGEAHAHVLDRCRDTPLAGRCRLVETLITSLWRDAAEKFAYGEDYFHTALRMLMMRVALLCSDGDMPPRDTVIRGGLAPAKLKRVLRRIEDAALIEPTLAELAAIAGLSVKHFARAFKQSTGLSPNHWLLRRRIDHAEALLRDSALPLAEVAILCGYADQSHFGAAFRKARGLSPGRYRRLSATD